MGWHIKIYELTSKYKSGILYTRLHAKVSKANIVSRVSETTVSGRPNCAKTVRNRCITALDVVEVIWKTSIHLEWASIRMRNMLFRNGPAKSMCTLAQGRVGQFQGCKGATGGAARFF